MNVVAAVDRSERAPSVVEVAHRIATAFDDPLRVVHVLSQSEFLELERTSVEETGRPVDLDEIRGIAAEFAETAGEGLDGTFEPVGLVGRAGREVVRYAQDNDARYVVVGPRKQSPAGKAIFGSTAQSILLNAHCPVVSIITE